MHLSNAMVGFNFTTINLQTLCIANGMTHENSKGLKTKFAPLNKLNELTTVNWKKAQC